MQDEHAKLVEIELGAGTTVVSVRHLGYLMARDCGAQIIRINPAECDVDSAADVGIAMPALAALTGIAALLSAKWPMR